MATAASMGFSKIIILVGAVIFAQAVLIKAIQSLGYTGTLLVKNGKLSDVLGELQGLVKGYAEKEGDGSESDYSDAIANQVRRLAMEVRQLASSRQITVLSGSSSGNLTSMVVPAATFGAVGYGYMWWKGLSFSDLMYVTKNNMANAVTSLTKNLEQVSDALAAAKRHLTQRIENLDGKLDDQVQISKLIKNEVTNVRGDVSQIGYDLDSLNKMISGLNGKIMTLEEKQDMTNLGVWYLCNMVDGNKLSGNAQEQFKLAGKSFGGHLSSGGILSLEGVKEIAENLDPENKSRMLTRRRTVKLI